MPAIFPTGTSHLAMLRSLASRGDIYAEALMAIMNNTYWPSLTVGAETSNVIRLAGQIKDQDGSTVSGVKHLKLRAYFAQTQKTEVAYATTAALAAVTAAGTGVGKTLTENANAALTVDGVAVAVGDRILVKNQAAGANNGIYTVTATGSDAAVFVLTRAIDFDTALETTYGSSFFVRGGNTNTGKTFVMSQVAAITIETTALTFADLDSLVSLGLGAAGATIKSKIDARNLWIQTSATGGFSVDVTGVAATIGDVLIEAVTDNGETELVKITFA